MSRLVAHSEGVVLSRAGGIYRVHTAGQVVEATLRGRMKHGTQKHVLVGDHVTLAMRADGGATIEAVHERSSILKRRSPGRSRGVRAVAANVDQVVVVGSARDPEWDPSLVDRFTAVAQANDLPTVVVINKVDLDPAAERHAEPYRQAGYSVLLTSATREYGIEELRRQLAGRVSLFSGPTGVGKSSLLNALEPGLRLRTAAVSRRTRAGRHTTVSAEMHPLGEDGFVVDTPGLRDVGLWGLEPREVAAVFPEFGEYAAGCRFDDCRHLEEPGCAVADAVGCGALAASRYESYRLLLEEAERAARPWLG
ncbi:MAG: ribosome small subunit-dependent GTPase A [Gemmatimonadetes bacterium]|nr:ribosome small subunit-dependent GTPase A [Gemmatimonadota bacterium]